MKKVLLAFGVILILLVGVGAALLRSFEGPTALPAPSRIEIIFDGVTLIEPGTRRDPHRRLVVSDGHIIEDTQSETETTTGPWSGAFVLPGLVDAHGHFPPTFLPGQVELFAFLFLRHGVTGVRSLGDVGAGSSERARDSEREGLFAGPRVATCGRFVDGDPPLFSNAVVVRGPEDGRNAVNALADAGYDCIKVYNQLDAPTLSAIREAARARNLPVVGHVPYRVGLEAAHLDDSQHLLGVVPLNAVPTFPPDTGGWLALDEARIDAVIDSVLADGAAMTPTLSPLARMPHAREALADPHDAVHLFLPPWYGRALWALDGMNPARGMTPDQIEDLDGVVLQQQFVLKRLHRAGVRLRIGTDTLAPLVVPGASLHGELALWVAAGFTPEEVLAVATGSAEEIFGLAGLGTLRPGAPADFVVYAEDPTLDLSGLDSILAVVQDGRLYTRQMLDDQQARYREAFDGTLQQKVLTPLVRAGLGAAMRQAAGINQNADESRP